VTTARDTAHRYLVTVGPELLAGEPDDIHLAVLTWNDRLEAWIHGPAVCGRSVPQGELPEGTKATCADCLGRKAAYERILAVDPKELQTAYVEVFEQLPRAAAAELLVTMTRDPLITPTNAVMLAATLVVTGYGLGWITDTTVEARTVPIPRPPSSARPKQVTVLAPSPPAMAVVVDHGDGGGHVLAIRPGGDYDRIDRVFFLPAEGLVAVAVGDPAADGWPELPSVPAPARVLADIFVPARCSAIRAANMTRYSWEG
jgi:hypothetical protein